MADREMIARHACCYFAVGRTYTEVRGFRQKSRLLRHYRRMLIALDARGTNRDQDFKLSQYPQLLSLENILVGNGRPLPGGGRGREEDCYLRHWR
jgi:hypothetical protein